MVKDPLLHCIVIRCPTHLQMTDWSVTNNNAQPTNERSSRQSEWSLCNITRNASPRPPHDLKRKAGCEWTRCWHMTRDAPVTRQAAQTAPPPPGSPSGGHGLSRRPSSASTLTTVTHFNLKDKNHSHCGVRQLQGCKSWLFWRWLHINHSVVI